MTAAGGSRPGVSAAAIEGATLYRTLRALEANGNVSSTWEAGDGPARRNYSLTRIGEAHLSDWAHLLETLGAAMIEFARETKFSSGDGDEAQ